MSGPNRAPVRPTVATLPACEPGRGTTWKWIDHSLEHGVNSTSTRVLSHSKANLASPSNCSDKPDHFKTSSEPEGRDFTYNTYWFGDASDTAPMTALSGNASWSGIMAGVTDGSSGNGGAFVHGDANLTVAGLAAAGEASVNVEFTNIVREDGASLADMVWQELPLQSRSFGTDDVRFRETDRGYARRASFGAQAEGSLFGHVYGPNGGEIGGLFHWDNIAGAFAVKRDD